MSSGLKRAAAGLMWLLFTLSTLAVLMLQLFGIFVYLATGNVWVKDWLYRTGKSVDQLANAAWFRGNPKETVSSHAGRWLRAETAGVALDAQTTAVPPWVRVVGWLTDRVEPGHVRRAIEASFKDEPL